MKASPQAASLGGRRGYRPAGPASTLTRRAASEGASHGKNRLDSRNRLDVRNRLHGRTGARSPGSTIRPDCRLDATLEWVPLEHARPGGRAAGLTCPRQQHRPRPPPGTSPGARPATVAMSQRCGFS